MARSDAGLDGTIEVFIVSGFLGAGKTTLIKHVLTHSADMVIGVVVNDLAALNVDAELIREAGGQAPHVVTLEDGCICCERSGDLLPCIEQLFIRKEASADPRPFDVILVECTGLAEPAALVERMERKGTDFARVVERTRVAGVVTMLDASAFEAYYNSRSRSRLDKQCLVDLVVRQVEDASCVIITKRDLVSPAKAAVIHDLCRHLNPTATIIERDHARVDLADLRAACPADSTKGNGRRAKRPRPEGDEENASAAMLCVELPTETPRVRSFVYSRKRPFHPGYLKERLVPALPTHRTLSIDAVAVGAGAGAGAGEGQAAAETGPLGGLLRAKGHAFIASQPALRFFLSYAGCHFRIADAGPWPGAPATEIVFIGLDMEPREVIALLDACLVDNAAAQAPASAAPTGVSSPGRS